MYYINVSIWDTSGNYNQSNTSFRTAQTVAGAAYDPYVCPSPIANWYFACNTCPTLPTCDMQGYDLYLQGSGTSELTGDITNVKNVYQMTGCNMVATTGRNFYFMKN
jgi:hypothetical protein